MNLYGLIGYPLGHSFSKKYFTEKFRKERLDNLYELFPMNSLEEINSLIKNPDLKGFNVTIPYKKEILSYLDDRSNIPADLMACNCVRIKEGRTYGYNTDVIGFERTIVPKLSIYHKKALILGNGGASEAVKYVLKRNGISYTIVSRQIHDDSNITYEQLDEEMIGDHHIIINTTPMGMVPLTEAFPNIDYNAIGSRHLLYDLVYNPPKTLFLQKGEEQGAAIQNGYEMLLIQAEESWRIWENQ
ncbi:MAG: shikimate dehydrogenase [Ferruginibacter sp.]